MRKIIMNLAMSLDGYIASETGTFDWIVGDGDNTLNTEDSFDFEEFLSSVDTIVMGRKAFEDCPLELFSKHKVLVATSQLKESYDNVNFINGDLANCLKLEQQKEGKDIYLFGGGGLIDPLIKADIIDEYIIGIIPTILGKGRKLFYDNNPTIKLHLKDYTISGGIVIMTYMKRKTD
ncbi:MAG: dihydrofolate reductase family protein [Clostridiales bacterium]|nr:dihydrofolate reductase family protein [Clostridiales bacterium]